MTRSGPPSCRSLVPGGPIDDRVQREALRRLGAWTREHGIGSALPAHQAARDLLLRTPPRGRPGGALVPPGGALVPPGRPAAEALIELVPALTGGVLAVQGPPGSGKTWAAARAVVRLVAAGQRVGLAGRERADAARDAEGGRRRPLRVEVGRPHRAQPGRRRGAAGRGRRRGSGHLVAVRPGGHDRRGRYPGRRRGRPALARERAGHVRLRHQPRPGRRPPAAGPAGEGRPPARRRRVRA